MRLVTSRPISRPALALAVAFMVGFSSAPGIVRAQEVAPASGTAGIASSGETVLLRESPGYDAAVVAPAPDGSTLEVAGGPVAAADGSSWLPVVIGGQSGYVPARYVASEVAAAPVADPVVVAEVVEPAEIAEGTEPPPVVAPVAAEPASDPAASAALSGSAVTTTDANLRSGPGAEAAVMQVLPPGSPVTIEGPAENGFVPVTGGGTSGWLAAELVSDAATTTSPPPVVATDAGVLPAPVAAADLTTAPPVVVAEPAPAPSNRESTGIAWPISGGEWEVVQGYNNGTHTNRSSFAQYKYSLDWARSDGDTAGQPVYAPVSGTIEWTDRGSGGMLVDAGNGYCVAVFHVTIDRGLQSGDRVERGQRIGKISGPGGDGFMSMAHIDMTCWRLDGGGHESVPFSGPNAIAGQEFPDTGGGNQHMGTTVAP